MGVPKDIYPDWIDIKKFETFYRKNTDEDTKKYFNITNSQFSQILKRYKLKKTKEEKSEIRKKCWTKWKEDNPDGFKKMKIKATQTMIETYGDPLYNVKQAAKTMRQKYGVDYFMDTPEYKKNKSKWFKDKYGVENPSQDKRFREKVEKTNLKKFGAKNVLMSSSTIRKKRDKTMIKKYGVISPLQNKELKNKIDKTLLEKYNVINPGLIHVKNKVSKQEKEIAEILKDKGFIHQELNKKGYKVFKFSDGKRKIPDFVNEEEKIIIEYNGAYWHKDKNQPEYWHKEWEKLGYKISIIWDLDFKNSNFESLKKLSIEEILNLYPPTYRGL